MREDRHERKMRELAALEAEFRDRLIVALEDCARGRWGLFGQNDHIEGGRWTVEARRTSGADALLDLGAEIESLRRELGLTEPFALHARFLASRGRKTANDPGEPRIAKAWLAELQ